VGGGGCCKKNSCKLSYYVENLQGCVVKACRRSVAYIQLSAHSKHTSRFPHFQPFVIIVIFIHIHFT
jgi:hypothetical protein